VAAHGSLVLVQLLAFEADPVALVVLVGAERGGHHGHAAPWTDRRAVIVFHAVSIPGSEDSDGFERASDRSPGPVFRSDP
jgi:hypothetical protein